jgi:hypothetical protein
LPSELRISRLPLSFHFYDAVPIMMARYLADLYATDPIEHATPTATSNFLRSDTTHFD